MTATLWIVVAALFTAFLIWRLRRANHTLTTILREERERAPEAGADAPKPHRLDRQHRI